MLKYAIATVSPDWNKHDVLALSKEAYMRFADEIDTGVRVLIYKSNPINAVVAEAEIPDHAFQKIEDWPQVDDHPKTGLNQPADYFVPLRVLYTRTFPNYISADKVDEAVDIEQFPQIEWAFIDADAYHQLTNIST